MSGSYDTLGYSDSENQTELLSNEMKVSIFLFSFLFKL